MELHKARVRVYKAVIDSEWAPWGVAMTHA